MPCVIGVDPGLTGGIAVLSEHVKPVLWVMPVTGKAVDFNKLAYYLEATVPGHLFLERSQAFPKMGVCSAFNYGSSFWGVQAICATLSLPVTLVAPNKWHRALVPGRDGDPKDRALRVARQLFPDVALVQPGCRKEHAGLVDAILLAEFGRRVLAGQTA